MAAIQKGHWRQIEITGLHYNEVSVMGMRSTALLQFHRIDQLYLQNGNESGLKEVVVKNKPALEAQLRMKLELKRLLL